MVFVVETVVSALLSASLQVLFDRLSPRTNLTEFFRRHKFNEIFLENLETTLLQVNAVLDDAEEKQVTNPFVRLWIHELKDAAYHTADLLDEIHSLALAESQASSTSALTRIIQKSKSKLEKMTRKLESIAKHKDVLGLKESFSGKPSPRLQLTSLIDEFEVYGRENDKKKILDCLLSGPVGGNEIPVIAIIGIGGVGKTTLAQLCYNDSRVRSHFKMRAWVYVSQDFDVFKVTKTLYESVTPQPCNISDLNILQVKLKKLLKRKKFLIVLDDVWNENYSTWDVLRTFLNVGASESRIIVTTRSEGVASTMRSIHIHQLQQLSYEDCRLVFAKHAFRSGNPCANPKLNSIGKEIVGKCHGLPLAAKVLGSLLYSKVEAHEWEKIANSNIWDLPKDKSDILPSLKLSYNYLSSSHVKQCFAYCSIFPKGYAFDKKELILLWMAEGFLLQPRSDCTMEEVGDECFHELLSKSFFQQASDGDKSCFIMHDLINDLAQFVSSEFCFRFERGRLYNISKKARHFSYVRDQVDDGLEKFDALKEANFLRTFLPLNPSISSGPFSINKMVVDELVPRQKRLRVLSLSHYGNIDKLPDNLGKLMHLRYLNFSHNAIKTLPSSIGVLYNLQTLMLSQCIQLEKLPNSMSNLINLGHLHLNGTRSLKMMPIEFGRLKNLQVLTTFVVSKSKKGSSISELGGLLYLCGKLSILELQNVRDVEEAKNAKLKDKKNIKELAFSWRSDGLRCQETTVLEKLHPHENIEKISITGYTGTILPNWLGDSSFCNMTILHLSDCRRCSSLPSLGQLSSLQELYMKKFMVLEWIGPEFYGNSSSSSIPFTSLRILRFEDMPNLRHWSSITRGGFCSLKELHVRNCQNLIDIPSCLSSLELLFIDECKEFKFQETMDYPELQNLSISRCNFHASFALNFSNKLKYLEIQNCRDLRDLEISENYHQELCLLEDIKVSDCPSLEFFSGRGLFAPNLTSFSVSNCQNLRSLPEQMNTLLASLQTLNISDCQRLESFPDGGLPPTLQKLFIQNCVGLTPQNEWSLTNMPSLISLTINGKVIK